MTQQRRVLLTRQRRVPSVAGSALAEINQEKNKGGTYPPPPTPLSPLGGRVGGGGSPPPSDDKIKNVVELASTLTPEQQKELLARLSLGLALKPTYRDRDVEMWAVAVHEALQDALGGSLGSSLGPLQVKGLVGSHKAFEPVNEFMVRSRLNENQVRERLALYRILADLVVARTRTVCRHTGAPLALKTVVNNIPNIAAIFDAAFPGYLAAGLAPVVARQLCHRST